MYDHELGSNVLCTEAQHRNFWLVQSI